MPFILLWRGKFSSMAKLANSDMPSVKAPNMARVRATSAHGADAEGVHVIGLGAHLVIVAEGLEFGLRHAQGLQQQRIGVDMHRLHVGEGGHHHLHFQRLEDGDVALEVIVAHFHVATG